MRNNSLRLPLLAALLLSCSSCQDHLASERQPECLEDPPELLDGLNAELPSGKKVSDLISLNWGFPNMRIIHLGPRNSKKLRIKPNSDGKRASIFVEREAGRITYIKSRPNPSFKSEFKSECSSQLSVEIELSLETDDGAFDERVTAEVIREMDSESEKEGPLYLRALLPLDEINGSFKIELPDDLSSEQKESAQLLIYLKGENTRLLAVQWQAKPKLDPERDPEDYGVTRHKI